MLIKSSIVSAISVLSETQLMVTFTVNETIKSGHYQNQHRLTSVKLYKNSDLHKKLCKYFETESMKGMLGRAITIALTERNEFYTFVDVVDNVPGRLFPVMIQDMVAYQQQEASVIYSYNLQPNPHCGAKAGQVFKFQLENNNNA